MIDFINAFDWVDITKEGPLFIDIPSDFKIDGGKLDVFLLF